MDFSLFSSINLHKLARDKFFNLLKSDSAPINKTVRSNLITLGSRFREFLDRKVGLDRFNLRCNTKVVPDEFMKCPTTVKK